jgi:zinc transport system ATP-binding protein
MAAKANKAETLISARGLSLSRNGRQLLDHVDVDVNAGEIVTLIGPNGAGKTTLVRVLLGLVAPDQGEIVTAKDLRIGYLPQRFERDATIPLTVKRFLTLSSSASNGEIGEALGEVGASSLAEAQVANLSGGEFQRVALAKTLIGHPSLLVLDEPVQNVDYAGEADLYRLIGEIRARRGCGILLVSHDLHVVLGGSDRVVCLNGHVCCSGVPESVAQHPEYTRLFGPSAVGAYAVYAHDHDHVHGLSGTVSGQDLDEAAG